MKIKVLNVLFLSSGLLTFCNGCGTIIGKTVWADKNHDFRLMDYKRYAPDYHDDGFSIEPVVNTFRNKGLVYFNGKARLSDLKIFISSNDGFCLPPRLNPHCPFWLQFTFPRRASVRIEDAMTKELLLQVNYKRAMIATGAGYEECREMIITELEKAFAESESKALDTEKGKEPQE